jgi:hypothetical protein
MKDWMWWFAVPALILLAFGLLGALALLLYNYPWIIFVLMLGAWVGVMAKSKLSRSTLLKLTVAGVVTGIILGTVIAVIGWLTGPGPFNAKIIAYFSFYFGVSFPVLFNLGYVKGKYGLP